MILISGISGFIGRRLALALLLPKHIQINDQLVGRRSSAQNQGVLFAPTHRWFDVVPPLTQLLTDPAFVGQLVDAGFEIYHSGHPDTAPVDIDSRVTQFTKNWSDIDMVITDYSSIAEDFLLSGGHMVIAYTPDREVFEAHQGASPLFDVMQGKQFVSTGPTQLHEAIISMFNRDNQPAVQPITTAGYFRHLLGQENVA